MENKNIENMQPDIKNRMELTVSGIKIRILSSENYSYMHAIALEIEERMKSFFNEKPTQGVDLNQRLLMTCLTFVDDKHKLEQKLLKEMQIEAKARILAEEIAEIAASETNGWKEKYTDAQREFEHMAVENKKNADRVEESNSLISNIQRELLETSAKAAQVKKDEELAKRNDDRVWENKYNTLMDTINEKDMAIEKFKMKEDNRRSIEHTREKLNLQMAQRRKEDRDRQKLHERVPLHKVGVRENVEEMKARNQQLEFELEEARLLLELYEEEYKNE